MIFLKESKLESVASKNQMGSIELLRGIASLMVCWFHLSRGTSFFLPEGNWIRESGKWGYAGVHVFFVISGFIIPYSMHVKKYIISDFWVFLKKRIVRIEPPYIASIVIIIALNYVSTFSPYYGGPPFSIDVFNILSHLAYLNIFTKEEWINPVYWTLAIEFQYYLLIALSFGLVSSTKTKVRMLFFAVFLGAVFLPVSDNSFLMSYTPFFLAGIVLFQLYCKIGSEIQNLFLLLLVLGTIFYLNGSVIGFLIIATLSTIWLVRSVHPIFRFFGLISFSLYLMHSRIGGRVINITKSLTTDLLTREIMVFVALAISIIAAWFFYYFIERYFKKLSSLISYQSHH